MSPVVEADAMDMLIAKGIKTIGTHKVALGAIDLGRCWIDTYHIVTQIMELS
jgi:hypothetical protein